MRKALLCLFILFTGLGAGAQSHAQQSVCRSWNDSMYERFTFSDFSLYGPSGEKIDFSRIDYALLNAAIFYETNRRRAQNGLPVFVHSAALENASSLHSRDMAEKRFFSHENPYTPERKTPLLRMSIFGVNGGYVAENITEAFGIRYEPGSPVIVPDAASPRSGPRASALTARARS